MSEPLAVVSKSGETSAIVVSRKRLADCARERKVFQRVRNAEMCDHKAQPRVPVENRGDAARSVVCPMIPRDRADVDEREPIALGKLGIDRIEARVIGGKLWHVFVDLQPDTAVVKSVAHVGERVRIVEVHGRSGKP